MYLAQAKLLRNKNLSKANTGKITFSMGFLGVVTKKLQNYSALFVECNLQIKQWFLVNLYDT